MSRFRAALAIGGAALALSLGALLASQSIDLNLVRGDEGFRLGVQAWHKGAYNDAVFDFEKILSSRPNDPLVLNWLGRAYFKSGLESAAIRQWQSMSDLGVATGVTNAWLDNVRARRSPDLGLGSDRPLVEAGAIEGSQKPGLIFQKPVNVSPLGDGGAWVVCYGTNEAIRVDSNGLVRERLRGTAAGLDRPFDMALTSDGRAFVTESNGNRVAIFDKSGAYKGSFGSKGRKEGQFVGPEFIASDSSDYLYVCDYGNRRVQKFSPDGSFVLSFGAKGGDFPGLIGPSGVYCAGGNVYVADAISRVIYVFDESGNYVSEMGRGDLVSPEALKQGDPGCLIVSDDSRVLSFNLDSQAATVLYSVGKGSGARITSAARDANGGLIACDFNKSRIVMLNRAEVLASGLFVQIDSVNASAFPRVDLTLTVEDIARRPMVGLTEQNFRLAEKILLPKEKDKGQQFAQRAATGVELIYAGSRDQGMDAVIVAERSDRTQGLQAPMRAAAQAVLDGIGGRGRLSLVGAGSNPSVEARRDGRASVLRAATGTYSKDWQFDVALRLAGGELSGSASRKAIFFVGSGSVEEAGFARYGLSQLAAFLNNNHIRFYALCLANAAPDYDLQYLATETGGAVAYAFRPQGIRPLIDQFLGSASGTYVLRYNSAANLSYGLDYLPIVAEAYLVKRSGRDELGCFAPRK
jgi:DNA-binding beta-propeller fold protein YncE